mmetsp:Transcript_42166/g.109339  ORF Transcript_42166/g.109339 Transcript_42166/m.109339 type:complete len:532 (-) Transcript_42166:700-2295(-)
MGALPVAVVAGLDDQPVTTGAGEAAVVGGGGVGRGGRRGGGVEALEGGRVGDDFAHSGAQLGARQHVRDEHTVAVREDSHVGAAPRGHPDGAARLVGDEVLAELAQRGDHHVARQPAALHLRQDLVGDRHKGGGHLKPVQHGQQLGRQLPDHRLAGVRDRDGLVEVHQQQRLGAGTALAAHGRVAVGGDRTGGAHALAGEPRLHAEALGDERAHVALRGQRPQQRQHGVHEKAVVGVAAEWQDGDAVVRLVEEGHRRVVHQHGAREVASEAREILHAGVGRRRDGGFAVEARGEEGAAWVEAVDDGRRVVRQPRGEQHNLCKPCQLLQKGAQPGALHGQHAARVELAAGAGHKGAQARRQPWPALRSVAAQQRAVHVQHHRQLAAVTRRERRQQGWAAFGSRHLRRAHLAGALRKRGLRRQPDQHLLPRPPRTAPSRDKRRGVGVEGGLGGRILLRGAGDLELRDERLERGVHLQRVEVQELRAAADGAVVRAARLELGGGVVQQLVSQAVAAIVGAVGVSCLVGARLGGG